MTFAMNKDISYQNQSPDNIFSSPNLLDFKSFSVLYILLPVIHEII